MLEDKLVTLFCTLFGLLTKMAIYGLAFGGFVMFAALGVLAVQ